MEDVITAPAPPSRFFLDDLNNFASPSPPLPSPFLLFSSPTDLQTPLRPPLLIIAVSSPSLQIFFNLSKKTHIGTLILPEIPFSGNSIEPSLGDKSCNIYSMDEIMIVTVQYSVAAERSHAVAKLLIGGGQIVPERVLILDTVQNKNYRGKLSPDESIAFKLETSVERKRINDEQAIVKGIGGYFPSGSVLDGLAAALIGRCEVKKIKGALFVSWPETGRPVLSLLKTLLTDVLPSSRQKEIGIAIEELTEQAGRVKRNRLDSELYT
ncbi:uncharacterized protein LOC124910282 [Impatiens glandulifera]|uniref:uncharacterized protein LOC124910282 n=1 Tax=Impatiens glandulifera TaxID=253017 RepID=UPI001FB145A1|nr:uncharacterized protein LOC124910282 [Impatiens glandulifera]XP_047306866.1 uncharacterized protein LOC124910282 [Impatiens glandulifera]